MNEVFRMAQSDSDKCTRFANLGTNGSAGTAPPQAGRMNGCFVTGNRRFVPKDRDYFLQMGR
jgi:hypothetical protein